MLGRVGRSLAVNRVSLFWCGRWRQGARGCAGRYDVALVIDCAVRFVLPIGGICRTSDAGEEG